VEDAHHVSGYFDCSWTASMKQLRLMLMLRMRTRRSRMSTVSFFDVCVISVLDGCVGGWYTSPYMSLILKYRGCEDAEQGNTNVRRYWATVHGS